MPKHDLTAVYSTGSLHTYGQLVGNSWKPVGFDEVWDGDTAWDRDVLWPNQVCFQPVDDSYLVGYLVPETGWSDYGGSDVQRANHSALLRDYGQVFVRMVGEYGYRELIASPAAVDADTDDAAHLVELFARLRDEYPVYDEEHLSQVGQLIEREVWDHAGVFDLRSEIRDPFEAITGRDLAQVSDERLTDLWFEQLPAYDFECESAVSGRWPDFKERAAALLARLLRAELAAA
ncbi:hypothetical protein [Kribbella deserti]|uniref:Uncharacterized protein n=1 Tax=Kribbella deserti TaxID=1926257 RepID=A0ABV6QGH1_9ACTN